MKRLGLSSSVTLTDYELIIAAQVVQAEEAKKTSTWDDIGGMDDLLRAVERKLIKPLLFSDMFANSRLASAPKGALFYGPPGCGKTMIARGIASQSGFHFINVQTSFLMNKWYGESQKYTAAIFSLARKLQPAVVFIDEVDSFLRNRDSSDHEATAMIKAEVMALWDGITTETNTQIIIIGATNRPNDIDPAVRRRMPLKFYVPLPSQSQRSQIFKKVLKGEAVSAHVDYDALGEKSEGLSGSEITEVCRQAVIKQMNIAIENDKTDMDSVTFEDLANEIGHFKAPSLTHVDLD
ncbi:outer mitochondrial transmembrane helix translocase-like isoform X2 [Symsagittifera roscoffensis]